jgi:glycolate oxidase FAD binding subunit
LLIYPETLQQLAETLREAAARGGTWLGGAFTKNSMGGPIAPAETTISTAKMNRVLQYEPRDLTVSVEAGLPFAELSRILAENRQMIPLDPPYSGRATIGGVVAANCSGPRRRLYGTARDMIIGMKFVTPAGKIVESGGMVVKNVAGLDLAKLMIGSFGTLAAIAVVNFKVVPEPPASRTFALAFDTLAEAIESRNRILASVLEPTAIDLLNPAAAVRAQLSGFVLLVRAAGNAAVLDRYASELGGSGIEGEQEAALWQRIREFTPGFIAEHPDGAVVRVSGVLSQTGAIAGSFHGPVVVRAGSGICYGYFPAPEEAAEWIRRTADCGWHAVIEFAPPAKKAGIDLWPDPGGKMELLARIKRMFDPAGVLNAGRLYGRI